MADEICYTKDDRNWLEQSIDDIDRNIYRAKKSLESLYRFKERVYAAQGSFNDANDHSRRFLNDLNGPAEKNDVVKKYKDGMGDTLTGLGMAIVDVAFYGLLVQIDMKIAEYNVRIAGLYTDRTAKQAALNTIGGLL